MLTLADLVERLQDESRAVEVRGLWRGVKGLGPASWNYLVMLAVSDEVKADVWIRRFVGRAAGEAVFADRASAAVLGAV